MVDTANRVDVFADDTGTFEGPSVNIKEPSPDIYRPKEKTPAPKSDWGTIILHWLLAGAIFVSLATGLRLSADAEHSVFAASLDWLWPQGEIWTPHFISAIIVVMCMIAYTAYMTMGRLKRRVSRRKIVILTLPASAKLRWGALNVLLYWVLFVCVVLMTATGVFLYLGHGGWMVTVHYVASLVVAGYIIIHVINHYMFGGWKQLFRLFRPQRLRHYPSMVRRPVAYAMGLGIAGTAAVIMLDFGSRDTLIIGQSPEAPVLDGKLEDPAWASARSVSIRTQQGSGLNGTGETTVEVKAVRSGKDIYFAFRWQDPTRSLKRHPLIKREDGWHMLNNRGSIADETAFYEDKFSVMFTHSNAFGSGDTTHMGSKPLPNQPGPLNKRGLHYTRDGSIADVWQWKASRGGMLGQVDDMLFGPPKPGNAKQFAGTKRYSAGYGADEGKNFYIYNYKSQPPGGYKGPVEVKRLPIDYAATVAKMGKIDLDVEVSDTEGSQWWMFDKETAPYSKELDATIPVGTVIPGVLIVGKYSGSRADVTCGAKWKDGYWTLETKRKIVTGHKQDLTLTTGLYMWVAAFDHNQTRHTRHVRPVRLAFQ